MAISEPDHDPWFDPAAWEELINLHLAVTNGQSDDYVEFLRKHVQDLRDKRSPLLTAIQQDLRAGRIVEDRHGRIWLAEWLPVHNGEVFEPKL